MPWPVLAAGITATNAIAGSALNYGLQSQANDVNAHASTRDYNLALANQIKNFSQIDLNNEWRQKEYEAQRYYLDNAYQVASADMRKAGINPALLGAGSASSAGSFSSSGSVAGSSAGAGGSPNAKAPQIDLDGGTSAIMSTALQNRTQKQIASDANETSKTNTQAQIKATSDNQKAQLDNQSKIAQMQAETQIAVKTAELAQSAGLTEAQRQKALQDVEESKSRIGKIAEETRGQRFENDYSERTDISGKDADKVKTAKGFMGFIERAKAKGHEIMNHGRKAALINALQPTLGSNKAPRSLNNDDISIARDYSRYDYNTFVRSMRIWYARQGYSISDINLKLLYDYLKE